MKGNLELNDKLRIGATVNFADTHGSFIQKGSNLSGLLLGALRTSPEYDNRSTSTRPPDCTGRTGTRSRRRRRNTSTRAYDNPFFIVHELKNTSRRGSLLRQREHRLRGR